MTIYESVWISASNPTPNASTNITHLVDGFAKGTTVFATVSLSAMSEGVSSASNTVGSVGCIIRSWQTFNANGSVTTFNNLALSGNAMYIPNCASVTFELTVDYANAYALGMVYTL
ncbi:hypothetical protein [Granulicella arctica]|uniref:hypothetical protein n=1 Tax=Granulicella arctica TaxID=940613 RepID=UPI0021E082FB|nr:hypothetical protein [Granulicella arctica]